MKYTDWESPDGNDTVDSIGELQALQQDMKKAGKKQAIKNWNSRNDQLGVARQAFKDNREEFTNAIDAKYAKVKDLESLKKELMDQATGKASDDNKGPVERSETLQGARDRLSAAASDPGSLYSDNKSAADGAQNFLNNSKDEIKKAANLKPSSSNLENAALFTV